MECDTVLLGIVPDLNEDPRPSYLGERNDEVPGKKFLDFSP
jgi:hypothetical protein